MVWGAAAAVDRGDVDDAAAAVFEHRRHGALGAEEVALHVEIEHLVVEGFGGVEKLLGACHARVVDEDIESAKEFDGFVDDTRAIIDEPEVAVNGKCSDAVGLDPGDGLFGSLLAAGVVHDNMCALPCQFERDSLPDSHTGAGDERRPSG